MPTPRRILGVLDGNIKKRKELTPKKRGQIVGARLCGVPATKVAKGLLENEPAGQSSIQIDRFVPLYVMYIDTRRIPTNRSATRSDRNMPTIPFSVCLSLLGSQTGGVDGGRS
ncbi:hypothetical protein ACMFMG_008557 [Clarireedia jacksonii]